MHAETLYTLSLMVFFSRSLWPESIRNPYLRLCIALILAPVLVAALLTLVAFLLAGSTAPNADEVLKITLDSGIAIIFLIGGFTLIGAIPCILVLWFLEQTGIVIWLTMGVIAGAGTGIAFAEIAMNGIDRGFLVISVMVGGVLLMMIRAIAGIRSAPD